MRGNTKHALPRDVLQRTTSLLTACLRTALRFMAFDRHMNLVLGDAEEYRTLPPKKGRSEEDVRPTPFPRL